MTDLAIPSAKAAVRNVKPIADRLFPRIDATGLDLDHLCRVRHCCNPDYLQPVTRAVNVERGAHAAGRARGFRCDHPATQQNTVITKRGTVTCRACKNAANARYRARQKAAAA